MKLTIQTLGAILIAFAVGCAVLAYLHPASDGRFSEMLHFAADIVIGAFALLKGEDAKKPENPGPKEL